MDNLRRHVFYERLVKSKIIFWANLIEKYLKIRCAYKKQQKITYECVFWIKFKFKLLEQFFLKVILVSNVYRVANYFCPQPLKDTINNTAKPPSIHPWLCLSHYTALTCAGCFWWETQKPACKTTTKVFLSLKLKYLF